MTREEVICVIQQTAAEVGHAPSMSELFSTKRLKRYDLTKHFTGYKPALKACGLERRGQGYELDMAMLYADWSGVALRLGKAPTMAEYQVYGRYSPKVISRNFGGWANIPAGIAKYVQEQGLEDSNEDRNKDVLEILARHLKDEGDGTRHFSRTSAQILRPGLKRGEPIYGTPTVDAHLMLAPTNEQGVVFLFGAVARSLGFVVLRIQQEYPDCEALREMETDHWQRVKIEFEYESRNFLLHGHQADKCNLIVCWRHNWEESPLEVIELRTAMRGLVNG